MVQGSQCGTGLKPLVGIMSLAEVEPTYAERRVNYSDVFPARRPAGLLALSRLPKPLEFFIFIGSLGPPHPRGALVLYCTNWAGPVHGPGDIVVLSGSKFKASHHIITFIQA